MQLATRPKRHLIDFRCYAAIGANWSQLVEPLKSVDRKTGNTEDRRLHADWQKKMYWKDCKMPLAVNKVCHWWRQKKSRKITHSERASETMLEYDDDDDDDGSRSSLFALVSALS